MVMYHSDKIANVSKKKKLNDLKKRHRLHIFWFHCMPLFALNKLGPMLPSLLMENRPSTRSQRTFCLSKTCRIGPLEFLSHETEKQLYCLNAT